MQSSPAQKPLSVNLGTQIDQATCVALIRRKRPQTLNVSLAAGLKMSPRFISDPPLDMYSS